MESIEKSKRFLFVLLPLFLWGVTLLFRVPHLNDEVAVNNVAHAFMLQNLQIWNMEGPNASRFAMKHTYSNEGDKFITYYKRYMDDRGNNYYVSHPSFAQSFAWLVSGGGKFFEPSNLYLMWLAMILHLIGAYCLFLLILYMFKNHSLKRIAALVGVAIYLFHPVMLFMTTYHYFAESVGQCMFALSAFLVYKYSVINENQWKGRWILLFVGGVLFVSSEWMGVFFSFAFMAMALMFYKSEKRQILPLLVFALGGVVAVAVFFMQHIDLYQASVFFKALGIRFLERSGFFGDQYTDMGYSYTNPHSYLLLMKQIVEVLKGVGVLFLLPVLVFFINRKNKTIVKDSHKKFFLNSMFAACFLFVFVFFSATITHYIYTARFIIPLILLCLVALKRMPENMLKKMDRPAIWFFCGLLMGWSVWVFQVKSSLFIYPDEHLHELASQIKERAEADESVFYIKTDQYPQTAVIWLSMASQRNIAQVAHADDVCLYMAFYPHKYMLVSFEETTFRFEHGVCPKKGE